MNFYEIDYNNNDLSIMIINYEELYLKELTYYGTTDTNQIFLLLSISNLIIKIEDNIIKNFYNPYINNIKNNINNPNIYNLHKILFNIFNIILQMITLIITNDNKSYEFQFKKDYLIEVIENYIEKFICPILPNLQLIISYNKIFKVEHSIQNLKKFIELNKNKFSSKEKIYYLEKFIKILNF